MPWCSGYHCCTTSFSSAWTQVLRRFKPWCVRDSQWWGSLTMVLAENKAKHFLSVNYTTKQFAIIIMHKRMSAKVQQSKNTSKLSVSVNQRNQLSNLGQSVSQSWNKWQQNARDNTLICCLLLIVYCNNGQHLDNGNT